MMIRKMMVVLIVCMMAVAASPAKAVSMSTQELGILLSPTDLVNRLLGQGVTVSNISFKGVNHAAGTFAGGIGIIGFEEGIVLSSGNIGSIIGPNSTTAHSTSNNMAGDPDVAVLVPNYSVFDATVLEFDFVPAGNKIIFEYVFGSEEYPEWVGSAYNDVFGFFINGINHALIPGTDIPVSVNTVNHQDNSGYYVDNNTSFDGSTVGLDTEMDGLTTVLTVTATVNPGETNHIKLVIADAGDLILDSWVMLRAESFESIPDLELESLPSSGSIGAEHSVTATATLNGLPQPNATVTFNIVNGPNASKGGTAVSNIDGTATWSYTGDGGAGTDTIQAMATIDGVVKMSNDVYKVWESPANLPPTANAGPDLIKEADTAGGALVTLNGSYSIDDGMLIPLTYAWAWTQNLETMTATGVMPIVKLPLGANLITLTVDDGEHSASATVLITVVDTTPPELVIDCIEGTNPHGENVPGQNNGKPGQDKGKPGNDNGKNKKYSKSVNLVKKSKPNKGQGNNGNGGGNGNSGNNGSNGNNGNNGSGNGNGNNGNGNGNNGKKEDKGNKNQNPDGFYEVTMATVDESDSDVEVYIGTSDDPFTFAIEPGIMVIKFTEAPGSVPQLKNMGSKNVNSRATAVEYHITLPGDPVISAVDASGNIISSKTCMVPPY